MKRCADGTYTFSGITEDELGAITSILEDANENCFDTPDGDKCWFSNDRFNVLLWNDEREALRGVCNAFNNSRYE